MKFQEISAGYYNHSLALAHDGSVWSWGSYSWGQLGNQTTSNSLVPTRINSSQSFVQVIAASFFSLALDIEGVVYSWGKTVKDS